MKIKGVLIDFDGVISKNSVKNTIDFVYEFINRYRPIEYEQLKTYLKVIFCFSPETPIYNLFSSLGIEAELHEFKQQLQALNLKEDFIEVDPLFYVFLNYCNNLSIPVRIFSLASSERIAKIKNFNKNAVIPLLGHSKANPDTFSLVINKLNINPEEYVYIDDAPLVLATARLFNFQTVMFQNEVYNYEDYLSYKTHIDYCCSSFDEVIQILEKYF